MSPPAAYAPIFCPAPVPSGARIISAARTRRPRSSSHFRVRGEEISSISEPRLMRLGLGASGRTRISRRREYLEPPEATLRAHYVCKIALERSPLGRRFASELIELEIFRGGTFSFSLSFSRWRRPT
jgi:hypothetical protein